VGTLGFVLGTRAMNHEQVMVEQLAAQMKNATAKDRFFYLVPNHIKFETEINVLAGLRKLAGFDSAQRFASEKLQVLSFSRLAWFLLRDTPAFQTPRISKIGMTMLASQVAQEHADELHLYASEIKRPGFIQKLTEQLEELKSANISADDFSTILDQIQQDQSSGANRVWLTKMHDVEVIYHAYEEQLRQNFLGNNELYLQLVQYLQTNDEVHHMHFFIDRFAQFTASEQRIVDALIENGAATMVSLVLDRGYPDQNHPNPSELPAENDLFYSSAMVYRRLWKLAQAKPQQIKLQTNVWFATKPRVNSDLQTVDRYFKRYAEGPVAAMDTAELKDPSAIQFYTMANRREELEKVATQIRQLVASGKYRYRDFLVLTRHLDGYQNMITPIFAKNQVPVFDDHERKMDQHPLVILLSTLFTVEQRGYQLADIMQLLKTWLLVPRLSTGDLMSIHDFQEAVFVTENWCLKQAIRGKQAWVNDKWIAKVWTVKDSEVTRKGASSRVDKLNHQLSIVRNYVANTIVPFFEQLKQVTSGRELATVLFDFLQQNGVTERLHQWQQYQSTRDLDLARRPQQVWEKFCQILQEYVEILGNDQLSEENIDNYLDEFNEIIQAGFSAAQYSQIPATLDQVVVSETGIVQSQNKKVVFMIGSTDDVMPEVRENNGLLTDQDKQILAPYLDADYQYLPADMVTELNNEPFVHYLGMLSARDQLIFTAPQATNDDKELTISPYMRDLANYLQQPIINSPLVTSKAGQQSAEQFISSPEASLSQLVRVGRQIRDDQKTASSVAKLPSTWKKVERDLILLARQWQASPSTDDQALGNKLHQRLELVTQGFNYHNVVDDIGATLAQALYLHTAPNEAQHRVLYASISQLQNFYVNQYEYFLKYGLRLQKRDRLEMSPDRIGTFFHKAMETFINNTNQQQISLKKLATDTQHLKEFINEALQVAEENQPDLTRLTESSAQAKFQYQQLRTIVTTMLETMCQQAQYTNAQPFKTEAQFGRIGAPNQVNLKALNYPLASGDRIYLRGRIDRIDRLPKDQLSDLPKPSDFLTVVDYKSSNHTFDLTSAYYGISLQLLTYLNGLQSNLQELDEPTARLAGALYLHLSNPKFDWKRNQHKELEELQLSSHEYKGILLNEPAVLDSLDQKLQDNQSVLYPLKVTKKGGISAKKDALLVTPDQLRWLQEWNKQLIIGAGNKILEGQVKLNPYRLIEGSKRSTGLDYSDFKDIYQFDNMLDQQRYRQLDPKKAKDDFDSAKKEGGAE
jgi:ATP-dependent helicase/nuclease subunit B